MKLNSRLAAIGSIAALIASPLTFADGSKEAAIVEESAEVEAGGEITPDDEVVVSEEEVVVEDTGANEESVDTEIVIEPGDGEVAAGGDLGTEQDEGTVPSEEVDSVGSEIPLDWVKRGGEEIQDPNVMFYNTADGGALPTAAEGGESPMFKGNAELGQDEKSSAIEVKGGSAAPRIQREKKGPVALVKKGRVFLR